MVRRQGYAAPPGAYKVAERYGIWVCKDFISAVIGRPSAIIMPYPQPRRVPRELTFGALARPAQTACS